MKNSKKKVSCIVVAVAMLIMCLSITLIACGDKNPAFASTDLQAEPIKASQTSTPIVLESMTDERSNYYLLDVGCIKNMYISTLAMVDYTGVPIEFNKNITSETAYVKSLTKCIEESITFTNSHSASVGISASWKKTFITAGTFSVKTSLNWKGTWENSTTNSKSTTDTVETAQKYSESQTVKYSFGNNTDKIGRYRYAVYGICDVYFVIQTNLDNSNLISWDTQVCARENEYFVRSEYSEDGTFNNTPEKTIDFAEDFYKNLPKPEKGIVVKPVYSGGSGTETSPYLIATKNDFIKMVSDCKQSEYYKINNDIDLGDWSYYGILNWKSESKKAPKYFTGNLDGADHTIKYKIRIGKTSLLSWALGLFPTTKNATIKNLKADVDLSTFDPQYRNQKWDISNDDRAVDVMVGGIVGYANSTSLENCSTSGWIRYNSDGGNSDTCVAGVVGYALSCDLIYNCSSSANIYARGFLVSVSGVIACCKDTTYGNLSSTAVLSYNNDWLRGWAKKHETLVQDNKIILSDD